MLRRSTLTVLCATAPSAARHAVGGVEFGGVALAVAHAQRMHGEALLARDGEDDGGIHAAGDEDDGILHGDGFAGWTGANGLSARLVVPQELVQLHLEAHRQAVGDDPVGQVARRESG